MKEVCLVAAFRSLQMRGVILRALELFPASQHLPHNAQYLAPPHQQQRHGRAAAGLGLPSTPRAGRSSSSGGGGGGGGPCGGELTVLPELAATAQALVEHVLGCCLQVWSAGPVSCFCFVYIVGQLIS